ncbi:ethanolamine ammonia-lyase subunit EutC [Occallatibacter riparius]|uniref:Ethanolamine ammonia-lyase small subunit n=1 Tax=Occallatibacter riparius TaxID=1002689 RepID=A0A9J7BP05_9BACT|nr:ethanolamine ammonia-lyase subunit EutC [Occallatibacter riparius]UWZ84351.1 ethanolamine ammonia-lyase subunit EutC [Occallatibacter riparius]
MSEPVQPSMAARLRAFTHARVGLGRSGVSQQLRHVLEFQRAHATARDAVHALIDPIQFAASISESLGLREVLTLHSAAADRRTYLQRPDLGRTLDSRSRDLINVFSASHFDLAIVIADGLSALAVERHAIPLLQIALPQLDAWNIAPISVVEQGRVAIGDEIGEALHVRIAVVLIGERPGLSSPDSLGAYVTWMPRHGRTDAERVCISNIRPEGLGYMDAAAQLISVLSAAMRNQLTGVGARDSRPPLPEGGRR